MVTQVFFKELKLYKELKLCRSHAGKKMEIRKGDENFIKGVKISGRKFRITYRSKQKENNKKKTIKRKQ